MGGLRLEAVAVLAESVKKHDGLWEHWEEPLELYLGEVKDKGFNVLFDIMRRLDIVEVTLQMVRDDRCSGVHANIPSASHGNGLHDAVLLRHLCLPACSFAGGSSP